MKIVIFILFCSFGSLPLFAQNEFKQFVLSGGVSSGVFRGIHKIPFTDYEKKFDPTLGKQLHLDWGLLRRFSVGAGFTSHRHFLDIFDYSYEKNGGIYTENPTQTIYINTFYARILIHMKSIYDDSLEELDLYWGVTQHFTSFRTSNNSGDPNFFTTQQNIRYLSVVGGVRYYPFGFMGVHAEVAIPGPYTFSLGLTFRTKGGYKKPDWWTF